MLTRKKQKAVIIEEDTAMGIEVEGVKTINSGGKSTLTRDSRVFERGKKLLAHVSKSVSDDACEEKSALVDIKSSTMVETVILTGQHQGVWIRAKVMRSEETTVDIQVLHPRKWSVVGIAVAVPKHYIRTVSEKKLGTYTIPIKFMLDDSVLYVACNKNMKVNELKRSIHKVRIFPLDHIFLLHNGRWLDNSAAIPNDVIFCIIHRSDRLNDNPNFLVSTLKKEILNCRSGSISVSEISSLEGASIPCSCSYSDEYYGPRERNIYNESSLS